MKRYANLTFLHGHGVQRYADPGRIKPLTSDQTRFCHDEGFRVRPLVHLKNHGGAGSDRPPVPVLREIGFPIAGGFLRHTDHAAFVRRRFTLREHHFRAAVQRQNHIKRHTCPFGDAFHFIDQVRPVSPDCRFVAFCHPDRIFPWQMRFFIEENFVFVNNLQDPFLREGSISDAPLMGLSRNADVLVN